MIVDGNNIYADEGKVLHRIEDDVIIGTAYTLGYLYYWKGEKLEEPRLEVVSDFDELNKQQVDEKRRAVYVSLVEQYIRKRYTVSDELAFQRQRDTKQEDFKEYYAFCESCKDKARRDSYIVYPEI